MSRAALKKLSAGKNRKKAIDILRFYGLDEGALRSGLLTDCDNVTVLSGGALKALLVENRVDLGVETDSLEGVYTCSSEYDKAYETPVTADWIYENICPSDVLNYKDGLEAAARMLVADVGKAGKVNGGYRHILAAFCSGDRIYVVYDAVYNIIDQRRLEELKRVGSGYTVTFDSKTSSANGTSSTIYSLNQFWLDVITDGEVESMLIGAELVNLGVLVDAYSKALLVSTDGDNFRYVTPDYKPSIGASYPAHYDLIYTEIYPIISTVYPVYDLYENSKKQLVCYCNKLDGEEPYGGKGERLMLLPDMRVITESDGARHLEEPSDTIPKMQGAVQHSDRLFGYYGDRLYASAAGDCTDFTEAIDNLPPTGGWETVTSDEGGFTAIVSFDGEVVAFTEKSMLTVRGSELPFSVSHVGAYGCKRQDSVAACGGWLYFASHSGILRYNGSRVECISGALTMGLDFADALVFTAGGMVAVLLAEYDGLYLYNPQSECWTRRKNGIMGAFVPSDANGTVFCKADGAYEVYELLHDEGDFSFTVSLGGGTRKRICSVSVTAKLGSGARLKLIDKNGSTFMTVDGVDDETVTRTCILPKIYADSDNLRFEGSGDVTLYEVRAEYLPISNRFKDIN